MAFSFLGGPPDREEDAAFSGSGLEIQDLFFLLFQPPPYTFFGCVTFFPWGTFHDGKVTGAFSVFPLHLLS